MNLVNLLTNCVESNQNINLCLLQDFDQLATLKAREMFDEVDRILYENLEHASLEMTRECQEWKSKFPHLRCSLKTAV